jgi:hypothetical protein
MAGIMMGTRISTTPGYLVIDIDGQKTQYPISLALRAADIPTGLTHIQVAGLTSLANLVVVLTRTLIAREVLNEDFMEEGEYDLTAVIEAIEKLGGDYGEPDIFKSEE